MSAHYYKRFMRLAARWPKDKHKNPSRDLALFLETEIERLFRVERSNLPQDIGICERRLQSLEQILRNVHRSNYPNSYKSGVFGLSLDGLHEANSDEGRKVFGLREKNSFLSRLFRRRS
ncbi:Mitochondrial nucleoid factor 1 [Toxocara canis]|uniref:Mitochondrial nucleoid factor 1 n=1 Tax=Toxocara canis TaxID=6265 RepID=A0A0B2V4R9_TOXCA|nr:Mitochondrial nucleoid factor 1 [Toxocara canis]